jgi:peptidoglycan/xylan/chitin deacetylase (PgdA/CDA1 family)
LRVNALRRPLIVLSLCVFLSLSASHLQGQSVAVSPAPAPDPAVVAAQARQIAEEAVLRIAGECSLIADAQEQTRQAAIAAAATNEQRNEDLAKQASSRGAVMALAAAATATTTPAPAPAPTKAATATPAAAPQTGPARVPILMYHHVANAPAGADAIRLDLSVTPAAFGEQLDYLAAHGYHTIGLADLVERLQKGLALPAKPVVLTFDDGYDDNYSQAFPALRQHGFTGTFFLITDAVGNQEYMTWNQAIEMSRQGMSIEPHGRTHADLAASSASDQLWQIAGSQKILEEKLGQPIRFYCYPSGRYNAQTITTLRAQGYLAAVTTDYGATHSGADLLELTRVRIRGADTLAQFVSKLETAP